MEYKTVEIALHGCDDSTYIELEVTDKDLELLKRIEELSKKVSTYACMPILEHKIKQ